MPYIWAILHNIKNEMSKSRALTLADLPESEPGCRLASLKRTSLVEKARSFPVPVAAFRMSSKLLPESRCDRTASKVS